MTVTVDARPTTEVIEDPSWFEVTEEQAEPPKAMDEFVALLAQAYVLMPLFA
jgi:hypothetical protein